MDVPLTPELEKQIARKVESGDYASASDVVRDALDRLFVQESTPAERMETLDALIAEASEQAERGETFSADEVRARLSSRLTELRRRA
jgi:antitoxin ParD1/3/4